MTTNFIEEKFNHFFVKLAIINHRLRTDTKLTPSENKYLACIKAIIPIVERLYGEDISLHNAVYGTPMVNLHPENKPANNQLVLYGDQQQEPEQPKDNVDDIEDVDGNKIVEEYTKKYLEQIKNIITNKWYLTEDLDCDDMEDDSTSETDSTSTEDNEQYKQVTSLTDMTPTELKQDQSQQLRSYDKYDRYDEFYTNVPYNSGIAEPYMNNGLLNNGLNFESYY